MTFLAEALCLDFYGTAGPLWRFSIHWIVFVRT